MEESSSESLQYHSKTLDADFQGDSKKFSSNSLENVSNSMKNKTNMGKFPSFLNYATWIQESAFEMYVHACGPSFQRVSSRSKEFVSIFSMNKTGNLGSKLQLLPR